MKLVRESLDEPIIESVKVGNITYDSFNMGEHGKVLASPQGLLGNNGELIPWDMVKKLLKKFDIK